MNSKHFSVLSSSALILLVALQPVASRHVALQTSDGASRPELMVGGAVGALPLRDADGARDELQDLVKDPRPVWRSDEVLVSAIEPGQLAAIAADHGLRLRRPAGASGYAPLMLGEGQQVADVLEALRADGRVGTADRVGFIYGAGEGSTLAAGDGSGVTYVDYQWHLGRIGSDDLACGDCDPSTVTVAVLDTGVAYEDYEDPTSGRRFAQASSLEDVSFVSPKDLVEGDLHPNDDHQHGTHITSLIASSGLVMGVAPGVQIMPVKVLDADNVGSEADLVEAIVYAVDHGANIINMSLCFSEGYAPSAAMRDALQHAADAGVLMVAAAGNDGAKAALYPAASPLVISVGASQLTDDGDLSVTDYSNLSPTVDILAPGGNLADDMDGDGYVDGILAETINPDDPTDLGLWFYAGTSQATALVSGSLVWLVAAGETSPERITRALASGSDAHGGFPYLSGIGAGDLDVQGALDMADGGGDAVDAEMEYHVAMVPFLRRAAAKKIQPALRITVVDGEGEPADDVYVVGSWWGSDDASTFYCQTDHDGVCTVDGTTRKGSTSDALGWGASVDAAFSKDAKRRGWLSTDRPNGLVFVTDGMVLLSEALEREGLLLDTPIALVWDEDDDRHGLGKVAAGYSIVNAATGGALRPEAVLLTPGLLEPIASFTNLDLDYGDYDVVEDCTDTDRDGSDDCTGNVVLVELTEGTGIVSDPLGLVPIRLVLIEGLGIVSDPLGIRSGAVAFYTIGSGIVSDPLGFSGTPLQLKTGTLVGLGGGSLSLDGYALGELVENGGWLDEDEYPAASVMMSSGAAGMSFSAPTLESGAVGVVRFE